MEKLKDLMAARYEKRSRIEAILSSVETEKRQLSSDEQTELKELRSSISMLDAKIALVETELEGRSGKPIEAEPRQASTPLLHLLRAACGNAMTEEARALNEAGIAEMRRAKVQAGAYNIPMSALATRSAITVSASGTHYVGTEPQQVLPPLTNQLVFSTLGATVLTDLSGDMLIPAYKGTTSNWSGETAAAENGEGTMSSVKFSPNRLSTIVDISLEALLQDSSGIEDMLRGEIVRSILTKLEATAFGKLGKTDDRPAGLLSGVISNRGQINNVRVVGLESGIDSSNALLGSLAYVTNAKGRGILKTTYKGTQEVSGYLSDGKELNGYPLVVSNGVAADVNTDEHGLLFANWSDFVVCQWGGLNVVADNITKASEGMVRFVINTYWDFGFRREESVAKASFKA